MTAPIVRIANLTFAWPRQPTLLEVGSFELSAGERLFLRGPSGSGKSTFLGLIAGVLESQSGELNVMGKDLANEWQPAG